MLTSLEKNYLPSFQWTNTTSHPLTTTRYLLVKFKKAFDHRCQNLLDNEPRYNKKLGQYINYRGIRDILFENFPILKVVFDLKEYYIKLNIQTTLQTAPVRIDEAISIFGNCGIAEYEEFNLLLVVNVNIKMLKKWNIKMYSFLTYLLPLELPKRLVFL